MSVDTPNKTFVPLVDMAETKPDAGILGIRTMDVRGPPLNLPTTPEADALTVPGKLVEAIAITPEVLATLKMLEILATTAVGYTVVLTPESGALTLLFTLVCAPMNEALLTVTGNVILVVVTVLPEREGNVDGLLTEESETVLEDADGGLVDAVSAKLEETGAGRASLSDGVVGRTHDFSVVEV